MSPHSIQRGSSSEASARGTGEKPASTPHIPLTRLRRGNVRGVLAVASEEMVHGSWGQTLGRTDVFETAAGRGLLPSFIPRATWGAKSTRTLIRLMSFADHAHISPADRLRGARGARHLDQRRDRTLRVACPERVSIVYISTQHFMLTWKTRRHSHNQLTSDILTCQNPKFLAMDRSLILWAGNSM